MMSSPIAAQGGSFVPFTKAERIRQLNDIDRSITQLLKSAGLALQILAANQESAQIVVDRREAFQQATDTYLSTLHNVDIELRRQIWALEEAEIIIDKKARDPQQPKNGRDGKSEKDFEGGTGRLDIGWLNSRSGKVGRDKEAELWAKARTFLEGLFENWQEDGKANSDRDQDLAI